MKEPSQPNRAFALRLLPCLVAVFVAAPRLWAADPVISFGAPLPAPINDSASSTPFDHINISDADASDTVVMTITFPDVRGSFPVGSGLTKTSPGVYSLSARSPASAQTFMRALVFTPGSNRLPDGQAETTTFTVRATDSTSGFDEDTVNQSVIGDNASPSVSFTAPVPATINDQETGKPFVRINISDSNGDTVVTTITFSDARGTLPVGGGLTKTAANTYVLSAQSPASAQAFLRALDFTPAQNRIPVGSSEVTAFTVSVADGAGASDFASVNQTVTPVNDPPQMNGLASIPTSLTDNASVQMYSGVSVQDVDNLGQQTVTLTLSMGESAPGSFRSNNVDVTTMVLSGTPANVEAALHSLVFNAAANRAPAGQTNFGDIVITLTDGFANSPNNTTKTIAIRSVNDAPTATLVLSPASFNDNADVQPFRLTPSDPDVNESLTVVIQPLTDPGFYFGTLSSTGPFTGPISVIQSSIENVRFSPTPNRVTNSQPLDFRFLLTDQLNASGSVTGRLTVVSVNDAPSITGVNINTIHITDDPNQVPLLPFANVVVGDPDAGETNVTVRLTLSDPSKGTLSQTNFSGSPALVTASLRAVTFLPLRASNRVLGQTATITLTITARDAANAATANNQTTIAITAVNAPPLVSVPTNQPVVISPAPIVGPFTNVSVFDDDTEFVYATNGSVITTNTVPSTKLTVTVTIDNPLKGVFTNLGGFVALSNGTYQITTNYAAATRALTNLLFVVSPTYVFPPNAPGGTRFTIKAVDALLNQATRTLDILLQNLPLSRLVTRVDDDGLPGSLRYAVTNAGNNDVITFAIGSYPQIIRLSSAKGPMVLPRNLTLKGPGADLLTISGDTDGNGSPDTQLFRVFATVTFEGLTLTKGKGAPAPDGPQTGGAVFVGENGQLLMRYCAITDSRADQWGGAIDVSLGSVALDHCLVRGNTTDQSVGLGGGAISLYTTMPCAFSNTTFSANIQRSTAGLGGGAIYAENFEPSLQFNLAVVQCTFAENLDAATLGDSIAANAFGTTVTIRNSIFNDAGAQNIEVQGASTIISEGGNVSNDSTRTTLTQNGQPLSFILLNQSSDRTNADPKLAPIDLLAKPTAVYRLQAGSPAIGLAVGSAEATDQLGAVRDADPDSGASEYNATTRLVLNEINDDPVAGAPRWLEFYLRSDSTASLDIGNYTVWVDGVKRHKFAAGTVIQPGRGIIVSDTIIPAGDPANGNPTVVVTPVVDSITNLLTLTTRSRVELRTPGNQTVLSVGYVGVFSSDTPSFILHSSLTLLPQFSGFALIPHSLVSPGSTNSAGRTATGTPFGSPNAIPVAAVDSLVVGEDEMRTIPVLANDSDADGSDVLYIVDVSQAGGQGGNDGTVNSLRGATVSIDPVGAPLRGTGVKFDPRRAASLQRLPEGATLADEFYYSIVDYGHGVPLSYSSASNGAAVLVQSPAHRLTNREPVVISGASVASYNGAFPITFIDSDSFVISTPFAGSAVQVGSWLTQGTRQPTVRQEAKVSLTIIGANDPPTPADDIVTTTEEQVLRIMGDAVLAGTTNTVFDSDSQYVPKPVVSPVALLNNDTDPDTDDTKATLHVVGVAGKVVAVTDFQPTSDATPLVKVVSAGHGLADGQKVLISGYGGHPSYNALHQVTLVDSNSFIIPVRYVDNDATKGVWGILDDATRASATSAQGAQVTLEVRADRIETSVIYNPRVSAILNHLGILPNGQPQVTNDTFYYAVSDSHGALAFARVVVQVSGVNDIPTPQDDPTSLVTLGSLIGSGQTVGDVVDQLKTQFALPPVSGGSNRVDVQVQFDDQPALTFFLSDVWVTDENTPITIPASALLGNDSDVDTIDILRINAASNPSHQLATVTLAGGGSSIVYNPAASTNLNKLAREETALDAFQVVVGDGSGGAVTTVVAVLVVGINDNPTARPDVTSTFEDVGIAFNPTQFPSDNGALWDFDTDVNGAAPDNRLSVVPVANFITPAGARVDIVSNIFYYDPSVSAFLDGLGVGQTYLDSFEYTVTDSSFLFANGDTFRVQADGSGFVLDVLKNDANYNSPSTSFHIISVGVPNHGGVATNGNGTNIVYTPQINFVGDEVFTYTVADEWGNEDSALVTVRVTVNQLNGQLQANRDDYSVARGETVLLDVLANDNILPAPGSALAITRVSAPSAGGSASNLAGRISYTPDPSNASGVYFETFYYEISGGGTATATGLVQIVVTNRMGTLAVQDDEISVLPASRNSTLDVLFNDGIQPEAGTSLKVHSLNTNGVHGLAQISADSRTILFSPDPAFLGVETNLSYVAVDELGGTGLGHVRILVGAVATCADVFVVDTTNVVNLDLLANDRTLQAPNSTLSLLGIAPGVNPLGSATVQSNKLHFVPSGAVGETNLVYTVTDGGGGISTGLVTIITVSAAAGEDVFANADAFSVLQDSTGNELDVLANDVAVPNLSRPITIVSIGAGIDAPNHGGTVTINDASDRLIYTPASGFSGEETFTYTMTDSRKVDTAKVVVKVGAGNLAANDDEFTVYFETNSGTPLQFTLPVLANDRVLPDFGQVLTITGVGIDDVNAANAPSLQGTVAISGDQASLLYTPRDTHPPYVERFTYEITDGTARRAQGVVNVKVQWRVNVRDIETHNDYFTVAENSGANVLSVLANDGIKPASANAWTITDVSEPAHGVAVIFGPTIAYTPDGNFVGSDTFTYSVADGVGGTGMGMVTVKVGEVNVNADAFSVLSGSSSNQLQVLANDRIEPWDGKVLLIGAVGAPDRGGSVAVASDGLSILYSPNPNYGTNVPARYPYQERFWYDVLDDSGVAQRGWVTVDVFKNDSDRDHATIFVTVNGVNDAPVIANAGVRPGISDKQTAQPFAGVTISDVDEFGAQRLTARVYLDNAAKGQLTSLGAFVRQQDGVLSLHATGSNITAAIRGFVFVPTENRIPVPTTENTTFIIVVDDGFVSVTNTATIVPVTAVNDAPTIAGTGPVRVYLRSTVKPFYGAVITEVDDLRQQRLSVSVAISDATHGYLTNVDGFTSSGGTLVLNNVTAAAASTALQNMIFVPTTANRVVPGSPETTQFTIQVSDGFAAAVRDTNTTVTVYEAWLSEAFAADRQNSSRYGAAVATTRDYAIVGAWNDNHNNSSGSAYILARSRDGSETWTQAVKLLPFDGANGDQYGMAVGLSGDYAAVGSPLDDDRGTSSGAVYVYKRSLTTNAWSAIAKIVPTDGAANANFGSAVAMDGDLLVVGAAKDPTRATGAGAAYIYGRNVGGTDAWGFVRKITASDARANDQFGAAVALSGDTVLIGAPFRDESGVTAAGAAYLFQRDQGGTNQWGQVKKLLGGASVLDDEFGASVALYADIAAVGSPNKDVTATDSGAAFIFDRNLGGANQWGQVKRISGGDSVGGDKFGAAVAVEPGRIAVGAPGNDGVGTDAGGAYIFERDSGGTSNWGQVRKLVPRSGAGKVYGSALALAHSTLQVGAPMDTDSGNIYGGVYTYLFKFNSMPRTINPIPDTNAMIGVAFSYAIPSNAFSDGDLPDNFTYTAALSNGGALPSWLTLNPGTGVFSGTPRPSDTAVFVIRVTATDADGDSASSLFTLTVFGSSIVDWRARNFGTQVNDPTKEATVWGDAADPDHDGVSNQVEYLFGGNPGVADSVMRLTPAWNTLTGQFSIGCLERFNDSRLQYLLETSSDLTAWASADSAVEFVRMQPVDGSFNQVSYDLKPQAQGLLKFFRVRVVITP